MRGALGGLRSCAMLHPLPRPAGPSARRRARPGHRRHWDLWSAGSHQLSLPRPCPARRSDCGSATRALAAEWCWPTRAACSLPRCSCTYWPRPMPVWACGSRLLLCCTPTRPCMAHVLIPGLPRLALQSPACTLALTWLAALSTVAGALTGGHPARPSRADRAFHSLGAMPAMAAGSPPHCAARSLSP